MAKEGFVKATWKEITAAILSLLLLGAVSFVFSSFNSRLTQVEAVAVSNKETVSEVKILMTSELRLSIAALAKELEETGTEVNTVSNYQRSMERVVDRLEIIVERLQ